jgi:hypothetical protein
MRGFADLAALVVLVVDAILETLCGFSTAFVFVIAAGFVLLHRMLFIACFVFVIAAGFVLLHRMLFIACLASPS